MVWPVISEIQCIPKEIQKKCNCENTGTIYSISEPKTERLTTRGGPPFVLLRSLKPLSVNTKYVILCNPKFHELFHYKEGFL